MPNDKSPQPSQRFYPARGPHGSTYVMQDGTIYCRTHHGVRRLPHVVGAPIHAFQAGLVMLEQRSQQMQRNKLLIGVAVGLCLGALLIWGLM